MVAENTAKTQKTYWPCVRTEADEYLYAPWGAFGAQYRLPGGEAAKRIQTHTGLTYWCCLILTGLLNVISGIQRCRAGGGGIVADYQGVAYLLMPVLLFLYLQYTTRKFPVSAQKQPFAPTLRRTANDANSVTLWIVQIVGIAIAALAGFCLHLMHDFSNCTFSLFLFLLGAVTAVVCGVLLVTKST